MRHPQVLVYESDGSLARLLRPVCEAERRAWSLREPRQASECLELIEPGMPTVMVLKMGRDLVPELSLVERARRLHPDVAIVLVGDVSDNILHDLGWDLGANYVLMPPETRDRLVDVVVRLIERAIGRMGEAARKRAPTIPGKTDHA